MAAGIVDQHTLAVSSAGGGIARQYRVQYYSATETEWQKYHVYLCRKQAEGCVNMLKLRGLNARIVAYSICPAAA